ncbi:DUF4148 domain-containing protein [Ramlibacter tataouinensis]|nr:DUF4148 domain-containing protein [Ramlibacter tataouinensis]
MNRNLESALIITGTAAAALAFAAMTSAGAYAEDITIDTAPFVSSKTRAEVRAEVMGQAEQLRMAYGEAPADTPFQSSLSREQVRDEYIGSRDEVRALTGEDSGSSYLASKPARHDLMMAGSQR